jgi:TPR repeat protein
MCHYGLGCPKNCKQARVWYEKSARKGFPESENRLGSMYQTGQEVESDAVKAEQWLTKAAEQGVAEAQVNLGRKPGGGY